MATSKQNTLTGVVLGDEGVLTLAEITRACAVHADYVVELVEEGVVEPAGHSPVHWRFSATCLVKIRKAMRLQNDLGVNMAGIALTLQLLDEFDRLNARLRQLQGYEL